MIKIQVILGTTRQGRRGEQVAKWILAEAKKARLFEAELVDLKDFPLPFYEEAIGPMGINGNYSSEVAKDWSKKIAGADGYIFVTPEYNHSFPAVLKNALDFLYFEWNKKPAAFVSYSIGQIAGSRAVEQLRLVAIELQMAPIRDALHIPFVEKEFDEKGRVRGQQWPDRLSNLFTELTWWAKALKDKRAP